MTTPPPDATFASLLADFAGEHHGYSPNPLWWWSGDTITEARIRYQLERFRDGGIWNLTVINLAPAGPLYGHFADDPPFMSDRWWELFRYACATARELGMYIWFYDQIGFSGANFQGQVIAREPQHAARSLRRLTVDTDGPASLVCPPGGTPLVATVRPLGPDGEPEGLVQVVDVERLAAWEGSDPVRLSVVYEIEHGFDYFSPGACLALFETIHGQFDLHVSEFFGNVIPGSFQDELPPLPRWGTTFAATFLEMHGYDVIPHLDALWDEIDGDERRIRHDYHATRASLAERAFFKPLHDWHAERGMIIGVDQQNPARAGDPIGTVDIYADYMKTHRWFSAPGSDHHGEAKLHSSLAHLYGHERVWIESFHTSGWGGTLEETFDWLVPWLRGGANLYNPHATYFGTRGGWFEWAPPSTDWRQPYWAHYSVFANAVSRLCWLLTRGRHEADVAVLFPNATVQAGTGLDGAHSMEAARAHDTYLNVVGRMVWFAPKTGLLDAAGIDYDILDDDSLANAAFEEGRIAIRDESYRTVLLPDCTDLEPGTAEALIRFADNGGTILALGAVPERVTSGDPSLIDRLRPHVRGVDAGDLGPVLQGDGPLVQSSMPTLLRRIGDVTVVFVPSAFPGASRIDGWPVATIDFDRNRYASEQAITVRGVTGQPVILDPFTGNVYADLDSNWRATADGVTVTVPTLGAPCTVLVWGIESFVAVLPGSLREVLTLPDEWQVDLVSTIDNRWGDFTWPASDGAFPVEQWTLETGGDQPAIATFGPRGRWLGPADAGTLTAATPDESWAVAEWSLSRGIHKDPLYPNQLGAAGHVAEEFIDFGRVAAGDAVRFRTIAPVPDGGFGGWLVIGTQASIELRIDNRVIPVDPGENARYQKAIPVDLEAGDHVIDLILTSRGSGRQRLRLSLALVTDPITMRRPDLLTTDGTSSTGPWIGFSTTFATHAVPGSANVQVGTRGPATIFLDGREVGRQGGYLPYGDGSATQRYDLAPFLTTPGEHSFEIRIDHAGTVPIATVDGLITFTDGTSDVWLMTDPFWSLTSDGVSLPLAIEPSVPGDPALLNLRQRPHPLPGARWLEGEGADPGTVLPTVWTDEYASGKEMIRLVVPPGATGVSIPVVGGANAVLEGEPLAAWDGDGTWIVDLPAGDGVRELTLEIEPEPGHAGGAALSGPVTWHTGTGMANLRPWSDLGLRDYSGIMTYRQTVELPGAWDGAALWLDLGDLRGSAAIRVNGQPAGTLVASPFRVDISQFVPAGSLAIDVEIEVANTLGPYMKATTPTPFVLAGQDVSGLFGPVRLLTSE